MAIIQLGTLAIQVDPNVGPSEPSDDPQWEPLDASYLELRSWADDDVTKAELLQQLLRDSCLKMSCQRRRLGDHVLVRIAVRTNDDGSWNGSSQRVSRLRRLFPLLDRGWDSSQGLLLEHTPEDLGASIQELYALIDNPPDPSFEPGEFLNDDEVFEGLTNYENPVGIRTMLYKYQIRSVARMLKMESQPGSMVDPSYSPLAEAGTGRGYYVDLQRMDIKVHPYRYFLSRGGLLCEQMGVGKTLICLALVLASRHQPTQPPINTRDVISAVTTDVSLETYPTASADAMRQQVGLPEATGGTPSLSAMCADIITCTNPAAAKTTWGLTPTIEKLLQTRNCIYYRFPPPVRLPRGAKKVPDVPAVRFHLAQTTLVVVPLLLVPQWLAEAETHLEEGALHIFVVPESKEELPPMEELIKFDIVLMSIERFRREGKRDPEMDELSTELLRARWKRIILDEGNIANNTKSDAMILADALSIERRWIVSGTPTTRLKQGVTETAVTAFLQSEGMQRIDSGRGGSGTSTPTGLPGSPRRIWTRADLDDVARLGRMLKGFLSSQMFQAEDFQRLVTSPLRKKDGPMYGAVDRIRRIMSAVAVKHRSGIIEAEVQLPESTLSAATVPFTHWQRLTYNALTALVASNVYTSNKTDADYFLHPRNTDAFNQVVANLHLGCLWFSSTDLDLEGAIGRTESHLKKKKVTDDQRRGLEEALQHMRAAIVDTPEWDEWMSRTVPSVPYDAGELPASILDAWSESPDLSSSLVDGSSLRLLRQANKRGADLRALVREGWDERAKHPQSEALLAIMEKAEKEWRAQPDGKASAPTLTHHREDTKAAADKPKAPKMMKRLSKKPSGADDMIIDDALDEAARNAERAAESSRGRRPLVSVVQTTSKSSKINWIIRTLLSAPADDKFIIFGTWEELAHLTDALELAGVTSVYAGAKVPTTQRKAALKQFSSAGIRVCLLELKFGARGLTLTAANRMIFVSPVWNLDEQAQAIKRIHRIGQTRPTHIDILVVPDTFEEDIVRREAALRSNEEEKSYSRQLIENPRFVQVEGDDNTAKFPILMVPTGAELTDTERECHAHLLASVRRTPAATPSGGSGISTPIVTPSTPRINAMTATTSADADAGAAVATTAPSMGRPAKRVLFAADPDDDMLEAADGESPAVAQPKKRARFAD